MQMPAQVADGATAGNQLRLSGFDGGQAGSVFCQPCFHQGEPLSAVVIVIKQSRQPFVFEHLGYVEGARDSRRDVIGGAHGFSFSSIDGGLDGSTTQ